MIMKNSKLIISSLVILSLGGNPVRAQLPLYLDETKGIEERVEDALGRMTLDEKIAVIHAQSKFSAPGVKRLGIPDMWTDDGPHGVRPDVLWDEWVQAGQTNDSCVALPCADLSGSHLESADGPPLWREPGRRSPLPRQGHDSRSLV